MGAMWDGFLYELLYIRVGVCINYKKIYNRYDLYKFLSDLNYCDVLVPIFSIDCYSLSPGKVFIF